MIVNLTIPDDLYSKYLDKFGTPALYKRFKEAIDAYKDIDSSDRVILISGETRKALEAVFQTTLDTPAKLIQQCKMLNAFAIGDVFIEFTPEELSRLDMQATFHGRDRQTFLKEMAQEIKDRMLENI
jgi:hypothetical protein